jgi:hypothetical protein
MPARERASPSPEEAGREQRVERFARPWTRSARLALPWRSCSICTANSDVDEPAQSVLMLTRPPCGSRARASMRARMRAISATFVAP